MPAFEYMLPTVTSFTSRTLEAEHVGTVFLPCSPYQPKDMVLRFIRAEQTAVT